MVSLAWAGISYMTSETYFVRRSKDLSAPQGVDPVCGELVNPVARP